MTLTQAQSQLVEEHGPRVRRTLIAWARSVPPHCQEDAIQDGMLGLVRAAKSYDPHKGTSFPTYATQRAIGEAIDGLRRLDHLSRAERKRHRDGDVQAGDEHPLSLQSDQGFFGTLEDFLADPTPEPADEAQRADRDQRIRQAIDRLPPRERLVIIAYHFEERRLHQIAGDLGVTESRVSQMRTAALARLKPYLLKDAA